MCIKTSEDFLEDWSTIKTDIGSELKFLCDLIFKTYLYFTSRYSQVIIFYLLIRKNIEIHISYIIEMILLKQKFFSHLSLFITSYFEELKTYFVQE